MLKKGDSVKVNKDVLIPDMEEFDISGWQGRIIGFEEEDGESLVEIEWDSITLDNMPLEYIKKNIAEEYDFESIVLGQSEVTKTTARDTLLKVKDALKMVQYRMKRGNIELLEIDLDDDDDDFEDVDDENYREILGSNNISVNHNNIKKYYNHIVAHLKLPCMVTGIESMGFDFGWEEKFDFGYGSKKERSELRKDNPSYKDTFELLEFLPKEIEEYETILVKVRRIDDNKFFTLKLDELKVEDKKSENYYLLDLFSCWIVNY